MKVLGLGFGRTMSNCEIMTKEVLMKCKEQGHEITYLNVNNMNIKHCTGCIACVMSLIMGTKLAGGCVVKDDFHIIDEAFLEADALVIAVPTYEVGASGLYRVICDRMGPSHDVTFRKTAIEAGLKAGKDPKDLPDQRSLKKRVCTLISVGGAMTENWTVMNLPTMYALPLSTATDVIDFMNYYGAMAYNNVVGNEEIMARVDKMADNLCASLANWDNEEERTKWRGDEEGACPVCHLNLINIIEGGAAAECPVCGIRGEISMVDGKLKVTYSQAEKDRSRLTYAGKLEHSTEIKTCAAPPGQIPNLKELLEPYKW